jgi:hypothetical protein
MDSKVTVVNSDTDKVKDEKKNTILKKSNCHLKGNVVVSEDYIPWDEI